MKTTRAETGKAGEISRVSMKFSSPAALPIFGLILFQHNAQFRHGIDTFLSHKINLDMVESCGFPHRG